MAKITSYKVQCQIRSITSVFSWCQDIHNCRTQKHSWSSARAQRNIL